MDLKKHLGLSCVKCLSRNLKPSNIPCQTYKYQPRTMMSGKIYVMLFLDIEEISNFFSRSWPGPATMISFCNIYFLQPKQASTLNPSQHSEAQPLHPFIQAFFSCSVHKGFNPLLDTFFIHMPFIFSLWNSKGPLQLVNQLLGQ